MKSNTVCKIERFFFGGDIGVFVKNFRQKCLLTSIFISVIKNSGNIGKYKNRLSN